MPHSLFVGRWQPFHNGHKKLIETVLKKKKPVIVAIRDTEISNKNPYTVSERWKMIQKALHRYGELVKIIVIPDIDEICYGRDVGYAIRRIDLDTKTEGISGTKTRIKNQTTKPIIWLTGQSESGKTTLAKALAPMIGGVVLDGEDMRESISVGAGFSKEDREAHNLRVARLAAVLSRQSPVVVAVIAPFKETRKQIDELLKPVWVYVKRRAAVRAANYPYQIPPSPHVVADSDAHRPHENALKVQEYLKAQVRPIKRTRRASEKRARKRTKSR